jgi:hypothetical protein
MKFRPLAYFLTVALGLVTTAASAQSSERIETTIAPPASPPETRPAAPSPAHIWVAGYWRWTGARHHWTAGSWQLPPRASQSWVAPRWLHREGAWLFLPGYWSSPELGVSAMNPEAAVLPDRTPTTRVEPTRLDRPEALAAPPVLPPMTDALPATVNPHAFIMRQRQGEAPVAPPRPRAERRSGTRHPGDVWIGGYWAWTGTRYDWNAGHWEAPPPHKHRWTPPRWTRHGARWAFTPGRWR